MIILELYNQSIKNLSSRLDFKSGYGKYWPLYHPRYQENILIERF